MGNPIALLEEAVTDGQKYLYLGAKTVVDEAKVDDNVEVSVQTLSLGTNFILENGVIRFI